MVSKNTKEDSKNSKHHTLFKKNIKAKEIKTKGSDTYRKLPEHIRYRLFIKSFSEKERGLHEIFNELWDAEGHDTLELRIHSNGGYVSEGFQFYNLIKNRFIGRTTTILDSKGYSMGATLFCMGDKRIVTPRSDLLFHDYSGGAVGKGGEIEAQVKHDAQHMREYKKEILLETKFMTKKEFKQMLMGKDFWMNHIEMCKRGIATHVLIGGKEVKAKKYLKNIKKDG